jgi:hypothetical protein
MVEESAIPFGPNVDDLDDVEPSPGRPIVEFPSETKGKAKSPATKTKPAVVPSRRASAQPVPAALVDPVPDAPKSIIMTQTGMLDMPYGNTITLREHQKLTDPQLIALVIKTGLAYRVN